jgi:anti-anti-sigma regulatory factor
LLFKQAQGVLSGLTDCTPTRAAHALLSAATQLGMTPSDVAFRFLHYMSTDDAHAETLMGILAGATQDPALPDLPDATSSGTEWSGTEGSDAVRTPMHVLPTRVGETHGVAANGDLDLATAPLLKAMVTDVCRAPREARTQTAWFHLDLGGLMFLDLTGLHALNTIHTELEALDEQLRVTPPTSGEARWLLRLAVSWGWLSSVFIQETSPRGRQLQMPST